MSSKDILRGVDKKEPVISGSSVVASKVQDAPAKRASMQFEGFTMSDVPWYISSQVVWKMDAIKNDFSLWGGKKPQDLWERLSQLDSMKLESAHRSKVSDEPMVSIKGDLYDASLKNRLAYPVYWDHELFYIRRGTWFYSQDEPYPCEEEIADAVEEIYQTKRWQKTGFPYREEITPQTIVVFFGENDVRILPNDATTKLSFLLKMEKRVGTPITRGPITPSKEVLNENQMWDDKISHLVLVVHGIGQKIESLNICEEVGLIRKGMNSYVRNNHPNLLNQGMIQVLPIQWRKKLELSVDSYPGEGDITLQEVTLDGVPVVRSIANEAMVDVLLYMTPKNRDIIQTNVRNELNKIYRKFASRNPDFMKEKRKVSIIAHSLGSVITFDLLCQLKEPHLSSSFLSRAEAENDDDEEIRELKNSLREIEKKLAQKKEALRSEGLSTQFDFDVDSFFCFGSPLGLFLTLRMVRIGETTGEVLPKCNKMYNIFHPYDPIAYRVEPLMYREMTSIKPQYLPLVKGGKRVHIEMQEMGEELSTKTEEIKKTISGSLNTFTKLLDSYGSKTAKVEESPLRDFPPKFDKENKKLLYELGDGRMDYSIQDHPLENQYVSALLAHFSYWTSEDVSSFVVRKVLNIQDEKPKK